MRPRWQALAGSGFYGEMTWVRIFSYALGATPAHTRVCVAVPLVLRRGGQRKGNPVRASSFAVNLALFSLMHVMARAESVGAGAARESTVEPSTDITLTSDGCRDDDAAVEGTNELIVKAGAAYEARELSRAITLTKEAHETSACVDFLFLLGKLNEEAANTCAARAWYERYLGERPTGTNAERAQARLIALDGTQCPTESENGVTVPSLPEPLPPSPPRVVPSVPVLARPKPSEPYWTVPRTIAWSAFGASAIASFAAGLYAVRAADAEAEVEKAVGGFSETYRKGEQAEKRALWLGVTAGALAGTGAVLLIVSRDSPNHQRAALSVGVESGGATARYRVHF